MPGSEELDRDGDQSAGRTGTHAQTRIDMPMLITLPIGTIGNLLDAESTTTPRRSEGTTLEDV